MKKFIAFVIVLAILGGIGYLVYQKVQGKIKQSMMKPEEAVFTVGIVKAKKSLLKETIIGHSITEGNPQIKVYTSGDISGLFIKNLFKEGDYVTKGSVIAYIDRDSPGNNYNEVPVESPIDGVITKLYFVDKGTKVASTNAIAQVANINVIKLTVNLGSSDLIKIKTNQNVTITSNFSNDLKINARVSSVTPFIDTESFSGAVTIYVNNKNKNMAIGLSVNVEIEVAERMAYTVPDSAVLTGDESTYIYVNNNNVAKQVKVKSGYTNKGITEIIGGVKEDDEIITEGNFKLNDGAKIKVLSE